MFANQISRRLPAAGDKWHIDEVVPTIAGVKHWLWRAVDQTGMVLDILVRSRRDTQAAKRLPRKLMKRFRSAGQAQRFLSAHDGINNLHHRHHAQSRPQPDKLTVPPREPDHEVVARRCQVFAFQGAPLARELARVHAGRITTAPAMTIGRTHAWIIGGLCVGDCISRRSPISLQPDPAHWHDV